mgnify:CR=1 FL=1
MCMEYAGCMGDAAGVSAGVAVLMGDAAGVSSARLGALASACEELSSRTRFCSRAAVLLARVLP